MTVSVRQPRVICADLDTDQSFVRYASRAGIDLDKRSYAMHVGCDSVRSAGDRFMLVSFPYKRAADGCGYFVIPKDQVVCSDCRTLFKNDVMYNIDLGDPTQKRTIKYTDRDGIRCERFESMKYVDNYMNFAKSAYEQGYSMGKDRWHWRCKFNDYFSRDMMELCHHGVRFVATRIFMDGPGVSNNVKDFVTESVCMDGGKPDYGSMEVMFDDAFAHLKQDIMHDSYGFINKLDQYTRINRSVSDIFMRSFSDGFCDSMKENMYAGVFSFCPPDKDDVYHTALLNIICGEKTHEGEGPVFGCSLPRRTSNAFGRDGFDDIAAADDRTDTYTF